jgi:Fe-S-cluster containining protein
MKKKHAKQIKKIKAREKSGSFGEWRKEFCGKYKESLVQIRMNTYNSLVETLAESGETIACRKGCTHCCHHYIAVSIAHGIVIVDYLYDHKALLQRFVANYEKWHRKGSRISDRIDHTRNQAFSSSMPIEDVIANTRPLSEGYFETNIPCPFLVDEKCIIYEVRPLTCSGHFSVSPSKWCSVVSQKKPLIHQRIPDDEDLIQITLLADPRLTLHELTLPAMIYRLLTQGASSVISQMVK